MFDVPGRIYVVATLLPLAAFLVLLIAGATRAFFRPFRKQGGFAGGMYWVCGGDKPLKTGAYLATGCMAVAAGLGVLGLVWVLTDPSEGSIRASKWAERIDWVRIGPLDTSPQPEWELQRAADATRATPRLALALEVGYKIDQLTAVVFAMVTVISTLIFLFSLGYMADEVRETVEDHQVVERVGGGETRRGGDKNHGDHSPSPHLPPSHSGFHRRGRFGRFFLFLSLFCFSMLNLVIADNLFQVFVSWELVGVCSFFLIGFYYERPSASAAANKAFIVNRIGDAGFLVGIMVAWSYCGTLNIEELTRRVRSPEADSHGTYELASRVIRVNADPIPAAATAATPRDYSLEPRDKPGTGSHVLLFPLAWEEPTHFHGPGYGKHKDNVFEVPPRSDYLTYGVMPYALFVLMGLGIFLGCVGKSAQVPLQTWLPDAMEGPTPVSALIHAATMVAAGVYLVGRCYTLFAPEVLLTIAYIGVITLFISATIALVQTDIKRILAYSTCSQLGFMMLALGIGGWVAGLLHLITHAFFKALLFLCSGSVIHGCHHEQDIRKMGGLRRKMPVTAFTMLVGVLAISGAPLLSGWYSKDQILATAMGYGIEHKQHILLMVLPLVTTGLTAYYMFRLWFLTFAGKPRDTHLNEKAHESPLVMTVPLVLLAAFSIGVAWGWPLWDANASYLGHVLEKAQPAFVPVQFATEHHEAHEHHLTAGALALLLAVSGAWLAWWLFGWRQPADMEMYRPGGPGYRFLHGKWYFDELYDAAIVNPTITLAKAAAAVDKAPTDRPRQFALPTLDGILNTAAELFIVFGRSLRAVQTGQLRTYVLTLALTAVAVLAILTVLVK
ncbi:MAG: NADH-quinone oxidoreductase subunit L [Planctomycetaceae bacterium]|nr:NADH-quinone oxidoreductase subunit L [Planctomycetaceae bacterium]